MGNKAECRRDLGELIRKHGARRVIEAVAKYCEKALKLPVWSDRFSRVAREAGPEAKTA